LLEILLYGVLIGIFLPGFSCRPRGRATKSRLLVQAGLKTVGRHEATITDKLASLTVLAGSD